MREIISASEAKTLSDAAVEENENSALEEIEKEIKAASGRGEYNVYVSRVLDTNLQKALADYGYTLVNRSRDLDGVSWNISWK